MNAIDTLLAAGQTYNILAPEIVGDYVEKINKACENPNGYTAGSLFLAKDPDEVQRLYKATALIASGQTLTEGTNCSRTKIGNELSTINSALSNEEVTRAKNGAHNLLPNNTFTDGVYWGVRAVQNADGSVTLTDQKTDSNGHIIEYGSLILKAGTYILSDGLISGDEIKTYLLINKTSDSTIIARTNTSAHSATFTLASDTEVLVRISLPSSATTGTTYNLTLYPMLRLATDPNTTYQPYAMTNRELTESVKVSSGDIEAYKNGTDISFLKGTYVKINNMVIISGTWSGNVDPTKAILTMPAGLRPSAATNGSGMIYVNDWSAAVYVIDTFGVVKQAQTSAFATSGSFTMVYTI